MSEAPDALLEVSDLTVDFLTGGASVRAVDRAGFEIRPGETLGLIGASGSGKTATALAILGLLPRGSAVRGRALWRGRDLLRSSPAELRAIRGAGIGFISQDAMTGLNPLHRVDTQVAEALRVHRPRLGRSAALGHAGALLERVGLAPERLADTPYPHEWSGGMRQRAVIAMAIANSPPLLIADEPTTALDVVTQSAVLELLREVRRESGSALLLITHDFDVMAELADRVIVMQEGRIIEAGTVHEIFDNPREPYTRQVLAARAAASASRDGCLCNGVVRIERSPGNVPGGLLRVEELTIRYPLQRRLPWQRRSWIDAVDGVSFSLDEGESLGLVGESGSGKSTLARALLRLEKPDAGRIWLAGREITRAGGAELKAARAMVQIVFQDHTASLNPRRLVAGTIAHPLHVHGCYGTSGGDRWIAELMDIVGLPRRFLARFPHELSGGERQRVAIARALALKPRLLVLDEPVTALDSIARAGILSLLATLQRTRKLGYLLIAHDLRLVRGLTHRVAVMRQGRFVETGLTQQVYDAPQHPYTCALLAALPISHPAERAAPDHRQSR